MKRAEVKFHKVLALPGEDHNPEQQSECELSQLISDDRVVLCKKRRILLQPSEKTVQPSTTQLKVVW